MAKQSAVEAAFAVQLVIFLTYLLGNGLHRKQEHTLFEGLRHIHFFIAIKYTVMYLDPTPKSGKKIT